MNLGTRFNRNTSLALATAVALGIAAACADLTDPGQHRVGDAAPEINLDLASAGGVRPSETSCMSDTVQPWTYHRRSAVVPCDELDVGLLIWA